MRRVIVSDVFGLTDELIELGGHICSDYLIIDPYMGKKNIFTDEKLAYQYFTTNVGLDKYSIHVHEELLNINCPVSIIGFSIGASAIWKFSDKVNSTNIKEVDLFYGSQIRNMLNIQPNIKANIVLPRFEDHFSVSDMAEILKGVDNVSLEKIEGLHGFMNKLSSNFNQPVYSRYISKLRKYAI